MEQITLIDQLKNIRQRIEESPENGHFICVHAETEPYEDEIKAMVRKEIGNFWTVQAFLADINDCAEDQISVEEANTYRIEMLNRMIDEVSNETK